MASIHIQSIDRKTERYPFNPEKPAQVVFGSDEVVVDLPAGTSELALQARLCGDYYAELSGQGFCRSAVDTDPVQAISKVAAR